ncbi:hypothetical protein BU52_10735 [Streptomyces toyocaensis]|uniref:Uncharacterized protein n=2 Tax=Streptomyces toyocaensis TaxID=55952 RepID=A0A081XU41_STRTO|nr:hypothetical protein BU52_10735 [Streptomyces toyocaensis]
MATKTAPKTFASLVADEEAEVMKTAPALAEEATAAKALIPTREEEHEDAQDHLSGILGSFKRGNDTHTAADLAEARAAVERAALLVEGQKAKANRLTKAAPNIDKSLSVLVAEAVAKVVPYAAEVIPSFIRPAEAPENLAAGPVVVITQEGKATDKGGILTAGITIRSFRLPHFQQIDKRDMVREFDARGWTMRFEPIQSTDRQDGFIVDVIRVQQLSAYASVPVIAKEPTESDVKPIVGALSIEMVKAFPIRRDMAGGLTVSPGGGVSGPDMSARPESKRFTVKTNGDTRTVVVEAEYKVQSNTPNFPIEAVRAAAGKGAQAMVDKFFPGVGVVEKVSHFDMQTDNPQNVGVRVVLTSKTA